MSELLLPRPDNVRGRFGALVTSDVYDIATRLQEVSKRLIVAALDPPVAFNGRIYNFCVSELCADGVERFVQRYEELDARIIEDVQRMRAIPFEQRFAAAERLEAKRDAEQQEKELEQMAADVGEPMHRQLERCGFIDSRGRSYAKRSRIAQRHRAFRGIVGANA